MLLHALFQRQGWNAALNQEGVPRRPHTAGRRAVLRASFVPRLESLEDRNLLSSYTFQTIDDPAGVQGSQPNDINNAGEIAGLYFDASGVRHSYFQIGNQFTNFDPPGEGTVRPFSIATGINSEGQIVGAYRGTDGLSHGYLLSGGQFTNPLDDPLGVHGTRTFGINAQGQIVGEYFDANFTIHGFLLSGGQYTTVDDPNAGSGAFQGTIPFAINASGQITGLYIDANNVHHGFLLSGGQYTKEDDPLGALGTEGSGINDPGQIVGGYFSADGQTHGYIQVGSQFTTVDDPAGVGYSYANGINDPGQIVGVYLDGTGFQHGFLAIPNDDTPTSLSGGAAAAASLNSASVEAVLLSTAGLAKGGLLSNQTATGASATSGHRSAGLDTGNSLIIATVPDTGNGLRTMVAHMASSAGRAMGSHAPELGELSFDIDQSIAGSVA